MPSGLEELHLCKNQIDGFGFVLRMCGCVCTVLSVYMHCAVYCVCVYMHCIVFVLCARVHVRV